MYVNGGVIKMRIMVNVIVITLLFFVSSVQALAAPRHDSFDKVLQAHVHEGKINYPAIQKDKRFQDYLTYLAEADPKMFSTENEKLAFWINAYNALAIKGIIDGLSPSGFFSRIIYFKSTDYKLAGRDINLYDLERDIIIPFDEPRIHFAIVCASASCPNLISEAYVADKLEQQLEDNTRYFINNDFKNQFDLKKKIAQVSKIFDWFVEDFKKHSGSVQKFIVRYVGDSDLAKLLNEDAFRIKYLRYDWSLNGIPIK